MEETITISRKEQILNLLKEASVYDSEDNFNYIGEWKFKGLVDRIDNLLKEEK